MTAEFKRRCLYRINTNHSSGYMGMQESMWAYSIFYPGATQSTPGRYRIRISKMTSQEFLIMMGEQENGQLPPEDSYSIQGFVEKWTNDGWVHTLDWIGDPEASSEEIEKDLNEMFRAFTTGQPLNGSFDYDFTDRPPSSPKKKASKKPVDAEPKVATVKKENPEFDWV